MEFPIDQYKGEIAALSAAFLWAATSVVFVVLGRTIPPLLLNFAKGVMAISFISLTLVLTRQPFPSLPLMPVSILFISGVIGIGLGDTAYFTALNSLGARRTLLIETLAPPLAAILALVFLGESLSFADWCGILLTLLGIAWVISERTPATVVSSPHPFRGIIWAGLAAMGQAIGAVLSRLALVQSDITPLWSTLIRLIAGTLIAFFLLLIRPQTRDKTAQIAWSFRLIGIIALTAFGSTFLGIWLQQMSLKFAPTGIAQTLTSTSPLFVLPLAAWMGDKITLRALVGVLIALAGIAILFA
nr:DMT family transporter [Gloeothece verrucosa]